MHDSNGRKLVKLFNVACLLLNNGKIKNVGTNFASTFCKRTTFQSAFFNEGQSSLGPVFIEPIISVLTYALWANIFKKFSNKSTEQPFLTAFQNADDCIRSEKYARTTRATNWSPGLVILGAPDKEAFNNYW